jgi:tetratricopeptide (TPR) repeat protein
MQIAIRITALALALPIAGCGGAPGAQLEATRRAANDALREAIVDFASKNYAAAEPKLTAALTEGGLNPDLWCEAMAKRAVCWGAAGRYDEALAELNRIGSAAPNQAEIFAARSFIFKKQGKLAEANAALAQAKRWDRTIKEF